MTRKIQFLQLVVVIGAAGLLAAAPTPLSAQQTAQPGIRIGEHDLGGVVTGKNGPEGGVWVIAETNGLPTAFAKIVVTDDQPRDRAPRPVPIDALETHQPGLSSIRDSCCVGG